MFLEQLEQRSLLAVLVWDGSANNQWSNPLNWSSDVAPMSGDDLVFPAGAANIANTNNLAAGTRFNTILLQGSGYNITGSAIELSGGLTANNAAGTNTFGLNTTLINAQTFMSANAGTTLNVTSNINTANLVGSYFISTIPAIVFDGAGALSVTGVISGAGGLSKLGGGTLTLGGANTYEGITEARQGFIRVTNNTGLGSATTAHTEVQIGAAVELAGVTVAENFAIREGGVGFGSGTDISTAGALRGVGGVLSTVTGNVELVGPNNLIGAATGSTLNLAGQILSPLSAGNRRLIKVGPGTVQFTGTLPNIFTGDTLVLQGRLELGKTGVGVDKAVPSSLVIGDNIGGDNAAEVRLLASNQVAQLNLFDAALNTITLNSSGVLNLNGFSDTVGNLVLTTGTTYSSDIAIGVGTLTLGGNLTVNAFQGSSGASPAATITATGAGQFSLGDLATGGQVGVLTGTVRTITINDTQLTNIATDLDISANITGLASTGLTKVGAGTLRLGGNNTFAGPFIWGSSATTGGLIEVNSNSAFGTGLFAWQNDGGNTLKAVGGTRTISNPISVDVNNTNFIGSDSLIFTGNVTLTAGTSTFRVMDPAQTVTFAGVIGEGVFGTKTLNKGGRGTLAMTAANTYSGNTTINQDGGSLVLRGAGSILNSQTITVNQGGTFSIDNNVLGNIPDRVNDAGTINLGTDNAGGGRLLFRSAAGANSRETVGTVNVPQNAQATIEVDNASTGTNQALLTLNAFSVGNANRHTLFIGTGQALSETGNTRISVINNPGGLDDGILPQAVVLGPAGAVDFATYGSSAEGIAIIPLPASAYVTDISQASATSNVRLSANAALSTSKSVNALLIGSGVVLSGPNATVAVNSGSIILGAGSTVSASNLNTGAGFVTVPTGIATISSSIFSGTVLKGGRGTLILSGDNQTAGAINVNNGVLEIQSSFALGSVAGTTTVRQDATLQLSGNLTISVEPLTLVGVGFSPNAPGSGLDSYASAIGSLRNVSGNSTWAGNIAATGDVVDLTAPALLNGFPVIANLSSIWNVTAGSLAISGTISGNEVVKQGSGQLEYSGVLANTYDATTRILDGTLLLNKEPGINAVINIVEVGTEAVGAPAATLRLGASDQMRDDRGVRVHPSGLFDLNGNSEVLAGNFDLIIGPTNAGDVSLGAGTLTANVGTNVFTVGSGGAVGSTIAGGTFALQLAGTIANAGTRTLQVNDGAVGSDLTITSAITDGTGLQSVGIIKTGFGQLELGGPTANSYTGDTTVNEGVLLLNKGSGIGGVNALAGRLLIGDNSQQSGFASSDIVRLAQPNQIPDFLALVDVRATGLLDLNGKNETIGVADVQNALTMQAGSTVDVTGATLNVIGNIGTSPNSGQIGFWNPIVAPRIIGGSLGLGAVSRTIDVGGDRAELPYELEITSNITGTGGFVLQNSGTLLLSGNNAGLSGDVIRTGGNFALGSDTALGSGRALLNGSVTSYGGKRTISTEILFGANVIGFISGNNTAGVGAIGGGGNDLEFAGPVNITPGTWQPVVTGASQLTFSGGLGETLGAVTTRKRGFGTMVVSSTSTLSGSVDVGQDSGDVNAGIVRANGGALVLRDNGTWLNSLFQIGYGSTLQIDNSGVALADRVSQGSNIDMAGGTLALVGKAGANVGEIFGQLRLRNNTSSSQIQALLPVGGNAVWRFNNFNLEDVNAGSNLQFVGRGTDLTAAGTNRIAFNTTPGMTNAIIPQAVLAGAGGLDFVTVTNATPSVTPFDNYVGALTSGANFANTLVGATATVNVKLAASEAVGAALSANALLLPTTGLTVSGAGTLTLTSGLLASRGASNLVSVTGLALGTTHGIAYVDQPGSILGISSGITGSSTMLSKAGTGMLDLSGANAFTGTTRVSNGVLRASSNSAFGTTAGNVTLAYGATVELNGVNIPAEQIFFGGFGESNVAAVGVRAVAGTTNTWNGVFQMDNNRSAVEVGAGSSLILTGVVSNQGMNKTGAGTLQFAGTAPNTFAGGGLFIWQGTVEANKNNAGVGASILNTNITVGDNVGVPNADQLVLLFNNQLPDANNVTVTSTGRFDYGANLETINLFSIQTGLVASGTITGTGAGALTIVNNSSIDGVGGSGAGGSAGAATLAGTLVLGGATARILTVTDMTGLTDVNMTAVLGASAINFQKDGAGRLALSGNSSAYAGTILLTNGETVVQHPSALGTAGGNTTVNSGVSLLIDGVSLAEPLNINGAGFGGQGVIRHISGASTTLSGDVVLAGASNIAVDPGLQLIMSGAISGAQALNKQFLGTLQFAGATSNTFTGTMQVQGGTLELNKTSPAFAIQGRLEAGNDNGAAGLGGINADVVKWLQSEQIAATATEQLVANTEGLMDLNGKTETIANNAVDVFFARIGQTSSGRYDLNGGTIILAGGTTQTLSTNTGGLTIAAPPAVIEDGTISLSNANTGFISISDTLAPVDFIISATFNNAGAGRIRKIGAGALALTGNNTATYNATTDLTAGFLALSDNNSLGNAAGTLAITGASNLMGLPGGPALVDGHPIALNAALTLRGTTNITLSGPLTNSVAANTITANMHAANTVTLSGTLSLSNSAVNNTLTINTNTFGGGVTPGVVGGDMTISGAIVNGGTSTFSALTKGGTGLLTLDPVAPSNYAGTTTVSGGNLRIGNTNGFGSTALGSTISEQQTITLSAGGVGGAINITYNGSATGAIPFDGTGNAPTAAVVAAALNALPSILNTGGLVTVASSTPGAPTTVYTITFGGSMAGVDVTLVTIAYTNPAAGGVAVQSVASNGGNLVNNGFSLQLTSGVTMLEPLILNNNGFGNFGSLRFFDSAPASAQTASWNGAVNFNATSFVGVDGGGAGVSDRLFMNGPLVSGGGLTTKVGPGELEFGGATDNAFVVFTGISQYDDGIDVRAGRLFLNKPAGFRAINGGGITIGDGGGGDNADVLSIIGLGTDHLGGNLGVTVNASGQFTLAGAAISEAIGGLTLNRLVGIAGDFNSGTGSLIMNGDVVANNSGVTSGATPAATVSGILNLNGSRNLNAVNSFVIDPADDLIVNAQIINGTVNTNNFGTAVITNGTNNYVGGTTVNAATIDFNQSFNNGLNVIVGGTLIVRGAGVLGTGGNTTVNAGASLILDNTAADANRIPDTATLTMQGGNFTLIGSAAGSTEIITTLTFNGPNAQVGQDSRVTINSTAGGVTELRATGSITRGGSGTAHFVGVGADLGSATNSRIQVVAGGSPFANSVLPWATMSGPAGFDLVTDADGTAGTAPYVLGRVTTYAASVNAGGIVRLNGGTDALTADRTIDALLLENGATVNGAFMLTVGTATAGLVVSRTGSNTIAATGSAGNPGLQFAGREPIFLVEAGSTLTDSATTNSTGTLWKDRAGTLVLSGDNDVAVGLQLTGATTINAGTLIVQNSNALGLEPGGTVTVNRRSALVFNSTAGALAINNKPINVNGFGLNDDQSGALRTTGGANTTTIGTGATAINWNTNPTFISIGTGTILDLNANVGTGNQLFKRGPGELIYSGGTANAATGVISVNQGTLTLNKTGTFLAVNGALTINDLGNFDDVGAATVRYAATGTSNNMIGDVTITVNHQGVFDVNGMTDTVANTLTIQNGDYANTAGGGTFQVNALTMTGGTVNTGTGILNLNGNLTYNAGLSTGGQAVINGNLNLVAGNRTFTASDGYQLNELVVNALISNGRLVKGGTGGLLLSNAGNTFLAGINEVQRIVIAGATAGTSQFNINFNGNVTSNITVDAVDATTAGLIDAALEALPSVGPGGVSVTASAALTFDITFTGHLAEQDVPNQITTTVVVAPGTFTPSTPTAGVPGINHTAGILSFSDNNAFGTARIQMSTAQLLPVGGNRTLANQLILNNANFVATFGGRRDFGGTDDLNVTGGVTLHSSVNTGQNINIDVNDTLTDVIFSGVVSGGGDFIVPTKRGIGRLTLSGNNTFDVRDLTLIQTLTATDGIRVEGGTLRLGNSNALGFSGELASVNVSGQNGAVLELDGSAGNVNITGRILEMVHQNDAFSRGLLNRTSTLGVNSGVLRSLSGTNSITAAEFRLRNINDAANTGTIFIGVDAGSLTIDAQIVGMENDGTATLANNKSISKAGLGSLTYSGVTPNLYTGTTAVFNGTLVLNKSASIAAIAGPIVVGDNEGLANSDLLVLSSSEQIVDTATLLVAGTGRLQTNAAQVASLTNEVQQIQVGNAAPTGQFRLQFGAATTGDIAFGATLASIQTALNALATIGGVGGSVLVQGAAPAQNTAFTVTFLGTLAGANQPQMKIVAGTTPYAVATVAVTTLTPGGLAGRETIGAPTLRIAPQGAGNIALLAGSTLALSGDLVVDNYGALSGTSLTGAAITGGTLDLRQTSGNTNGATINRNFNVNADAPAIDDLTITSIITDGAHGAIANVNKAGAANSRLMIGGAVNTFTGQVTVSNGDLAITSAVALGAIRTDEVQSYVINNVLGNASGTYTITTDQGVTAPLNFNASADEVQAALETIYGVGNVRVVSTFNGNTNIQYFIHWLPGARADYPITKFTPTLTNVFNTALSFADVTALDTANGAGGGTLNFEGLWSGFVTVAPADPLTWTFGTSSDDGSIVLIDLNNDGIYSATERIVNNGGSHGVVQLTGNVTFPAAGNYRIAIGFFQGGGGGAMEARFAKFGGATYAEQANINPGLAAQAGIWSDDASVVNQLTNKWFNQVPTASGADLDPSIMPITLTGSTLVNASFGAVTTHQEGGQTAGTNVVAGAALELRGGAGITVVNEPLVLNGVGILNAATRGLWNNVFQGTVGTGNLRNESGANVWQGNISGFGNIALVNTSAIGVDSGSLTSNGVTGTLVNVLANAAALIKTGAGVLETAGIVSNGYTGNTYISQGTFRLNKPGNNASIPGGEIFIGDGAGGDNADVILYAPTAGGDQIINRVIRMASTGLLNLNGISDTNNANIILDVGRTFSADVTTGAGVLTNNNQFTVLSNAGTTVASVPATFTGIYDLNAATRNVDVRNGDAPVEFDIQGVVQVTGAFGITKIGQGRLRLSGNNTYTGAVTVNVGVLEVGHNNALGTSAGGTTVANLAALEIKSATPLIIPELNFTVTGDGWNDSRQGVLNSISPAAVTLAGAIGIPGMSYLGTTTFGNHSPGTLFTIQGNTSVLGNLVVNGDGNTTIAGSIVTQSIFAPFFSTLQGRLFMATGLGVNNDTGGAGQGINNLAPGSAPVTPPATTAPLYGLLNFPQDSDPAFTTFFGSQPGGAAFTAVYVGNITIATAGTYYFAITNNDDTAAVWIDAGLGGGTASNNNFELGEMLQTVPCCNGTGFVTAVLPAGTFKIAFAVEDTGGGSGLTGRFQPGVFGVPASGTAMPIVSTANAGDLIKNDTGILTLTALNNYNNTIVNQGVLVGNNATSALGGGSTTVNSTGKLSGTGTILGPVTVNSGGIINPGPVGAAPANTGILTINNNVTFNAGSLLQIDINGTTVGTGYDQLVVGGTGSVTVVGNAVPSVVNNAMVGGTTGYVPANGVDAFKVLNKTSPGPIVVGANSFFSLEPTVTPQLSPAFVRIGGQVYSTSYNVAAGLNDGNDFVLRAEAIVTPVRIWDGKIDGGAINASNDWTLATNWVGDLAPTAGDEIYFTDVGLSNGKNAPFNNFPANMTFSLISFNNTAGTYTVTGNAVTLNAATAGGVFSDNTTNVAVTNNLNIALTTGVAAQTIIIKDGSTLNLGGSITLVAAAPLTVTNGGGVDANGSAVFGGTINGAGTLTVSLTGATADATFNGAIGGVTPLPSITVTAVDDLSFNSTIATTGNVSQTAGTGATILSGGNVGGTLTMANESFLLNGSTLTVVGAPSLTATLGAIADGNAAANNLTAPTLTASAITGINLDTTIGDLTATNTGAGNVTIDDADALNLLALNVANGNTIVTAGGALTDGATAVTSVSGNASFGGTTITLGENAGDLFNAGTLTFNSTGAVSINEDSATQLGGASTANGLILSSTGAITNAAAASLAVTNNASLTATSITLGNQAGDAVNFGSLTFTSAGAVSIAEDSATSLSGTNAALSLVLSSTGAITDAAAASLTVTNNASIIGQSINLGSAAGDTINFGTLTFVASAGTATVVEDSGLNLLGASTATGAIALTTVDLAAVGQDITIPLGSSVQSSGGSITLNAGDDAPLAGNVSAATTITVNVDFGNADPLGAFVTVSGVFTAPGGTSLVGNTNNDTFTVSPQTTTSVNVNGNPPTVAPGDVLNLNLTGTTNPLLTLGGPGAGGWSFDPPFQPVVYVSIEAVNVVGVTFYNLLLNANTSSFGNTNVDDQILLRRSGTDFIIERTGLSTPPDDDDVGQIFQGAMANILSFTYIGSADNDIVTVNDGGGMIDFLASVPGVTNNPNIPGAAEFLFNGNGGTDSLIYNMTGATASQTYAIGSGTGAAGLDGEVSSTSGGATLLTYFTNVELTQRIGTGATPGGLSILGDLSANVLTTAANGAFTRTSAPGYTPFDFSGNNYSALAVSGLAGADTLDLLSLGTGQTNNTPITLNGDADVDTLRVRSTSGQTGLVNLNGGLGSDFFQLFDAANTVDAIAGTVVVDGTDGNVGGNTDTLTIVDTGDLTADNVLISALNPGASADYAVEGINTVVGSDVIFRNVDVLNYTGTQGNDTLDTRLVNTTPPHDLSIVTVNGWLGADQFLLFTSDQAGGTGAGVTPTGIASGVAAINLNGDAPGNPNGLDGNDIFGQTAPGIVGTGSGNVGLVVPDTVRGIRPSVSTGITINGGEPTGPAVPTADTIGDVLNLDVSGLPGSSALVVPTLNGVVATTGFQPVAYSQIEDINLIINNQLINVQMGDVFVRGTAGVDLIQFMRAPTLLDANHTRARVNSLVVDFTLTGKTVAYAGDSNDYITQANLTQPAETYGEAGDDYISGAMGNDFLVGGLGADQINASGGDNIVWGDDAPSTAVPQPQDLAVGGRDTLSALGGNDVFYAGGGDDSVSAGGGNDYVSGGQGNDELGGFEGDDRLYGGQGDDNISGHDGNDLLSGGSGDDQLLGGTGNDVLFGGTGTDNMFGGDGNDLLVTGSVANEASSRTSLANTTTYNAATYTNPADNDAALITLLAQWGGASNRTSIAGITHDGVDDDVFGGTGDDDFCWETVDNLDDFPSVAPADFNGFGMGTDERFGPTS